MPIYYADGSNSNNGRLIQVHRLLKTDAQSFSASTGTFHNITGMLMSLTPKSATSEFLIHVNCNYSTATGQRGTFRILRQVNNGGYGLITDGVGDASSDVQRGMFPSMATADNNSRSVHASMIVRDYPNTTNQVDYTLQVEAEAGASTIYINRTAGDNTGSTYHSGMTSMIVYEVSDA